MTLVLGPMPSGVRDVVRRLIAEGRPDPPKADERLNSLLLTAGAGGGSYLGADGEVWHYFFWDDEESWEHVPDGPMKVGLVAIAAERIAELAEWLPRRPALAVDCQACKGSGWMKPPLKIQCTECFGMGWLSG
jgi:hypothetical protein